MRVNWPFKYYVTRNKGLQKLPGGRPASSANSASIIVIPGLPIHDVSLKKDSSERLFVQLSFKQAFQISCYEQKWLRKLPGGRPASSANLASSIVAPGSFSEGFRTKVLPAVTAMGNIHNGIMAGKLKGAMPAHTPSGCKSANVCEIFKKTLKEKAPQR